MTARLLGLDLCPGAWVSLLLPHWVHSLAVEEAHSPSSGLLATKGVRRASVGGRVWEDPGLVSPLLRAQ